MDVLRSGNVHSIEPTVGHPLPDDLVELVAGRFRALGEPTRIKLLDRLREGEASVQELTDVVGSTQQNVSKHLGVLRLCGIVGREKRGNHVYYSVVDDGALALCEDVCGSLRRQLDALQDLVAGAGARS